MSDEKPRTILIVEDETIVALKEKRTLEKFGFEVLTASTGELAVETMDMNPGIDLILMDINLGSGIDGTVAATRILAQHDIPLVFLSSHTEREIVEKTEGITSYGYIVKNSGEIVLLASIRMAFKLFESKLKEAEKTRRLYESEEKYRRLIENSHDIIYTLTADGIITFASPSWTILLGHPVSQVVGRSFEDFVHEDDVPECMVWVNRLLETGRRLEGIEYRVRHADGTWRWHTSSAVPMRDAAGSVIGFEGTARDISEAKQVKDALALEKKFVDAIFDSVPGMLYLYDEAGALVRWNRRHETMTGYDSAELSRMNLMDWYPGDEASQRAVAAGIEATMKTGFGVAEARLRKKDGTTLPMSFTASPITIDGKRYFTGIGLDITDRESVEAELRDSEWNLRTLFDAIDESVCLLALDGGILSANRTFASRLGKTVAECLGSSAFDLIPPDLARERRKHFERVYESGVPVSFEDQRRGRWIRQNLYPVLGPDGKVDRIVIYATDITDQRDSLESLRVSETIYRTLFEVLPVGLTISDDAGNILESNRVAEAILGLSPEEQEKRKIDGSEWRIVRKDGSPMPAEEFASSRALRENRLVENVEMGLVKGAGDIAWINVSASPIPLHGYGVAIAYIDISARRSAEEKVRSLLREKELLLKESHHRVKNNMATINSLLSLQSGELEDDEAKAIIDDAADRVRGMMLLYEELYDSGGHGDMSASSFLPPLIERMIGVFSPALGIKTSVRVDDFTLGAKVFSTIGIIINELITNSMKHAFKGRDRGTIAVSVSKKASLVTIEYADDGSGLPESATRESGTGFGMQLIGMLARQLGGSMRTGGGPGAKFIIEIEDHAKCQD